MKGAINKPSASFANDDEVDAFIQQHFTPDVEKVVVHCQLSQQRGPRAAARIIKRLQEGAGTAQPDIAVMRTGFSGFEQVLHTVTVKLAHTTISQQHSCTVAPTWWIAAERPNILPAFNHYTSASRLTLVRFGEQ